MFCIVCSSIWCMKLLLEGFVHDFESRCVSFPCFCLRLLVLILVKLWSMSECLEWLYIMATFSHYPQFVNVLSCLEFGTRWLSNWK
jgi:hypothetical protein